MGHNPEDCPRTLCVCTAREESKRECDMQHHRADCAAWHMTFGGRCLNCGAGPKPQRVLERREKMSTYRVVRMYFNDHPKQVVARGLTLGEAQAHCEDPETSSRTATSDTATQRTFRFGPWFDGYEKEN